MANEHDYSFAVITLQGYNNYYDSPCLCLSVCLSLNLPIYVFKSVFLTVYLSVCLHICLSVCLSTCLYLDTVDDGDVHFYSVCFHRSDAHFAFAFLDRYIVRVFPGSQTAAV